MPFCDKTVQKCYNKKIKLCNDFLKDRNDASKRLTENKAIYVKPFCEKAKKQYF